MSMVPGSKHKRECDKKIGGCGRTMEIDSVVTVERGKLHMCKRCASKIIRKVKGYD